MQQKNNLPDFRKLRRFSSKIGLNILIIFNSCKKPLRNKDLFSIYTDTFGELKWVSFTRALRILSSNGWIRRSIVDLNWVEWEANPEGLKHLAFIKKLNAVKKNTNEHHFMSKYFTEVLLKGGDLNERFK